MKCCEELSPQEVRIEEQNRGVENRHRQGRERVFTILESVQHLKPMIDIERARYFTESFRTTEGQPLILRWAKALKHTAEHITVYIDDHQLLVGRAGCQGRYGILFPELDGDFLDLAIEQLPQRVESPFDIDPADAETVIRDIAPYWKGKAFHEDLAAQLPPDTLKLTYDPADTLISRFVVNETASFRTSLQWVLDYEKVLKRGFKGLEGRDPGEDGRARPLEPHGQRGAQTLPGSGDHGLRGHRALGQAACRPGRREGGRGKGPGAQEGAGRDRRDLRLGAREPGPDLPRGRAGPVVHPDVLASGAEDRHDHLQRPHGPVSSIPSTRRTRPRDG